VEGVGWACVLAILSVGPRFQCPAPSRCTGLGVRVLPRDIKDELAVADDAGDVAVFRELEVDVALFPLGARKPGVDRRVRGDVALVSGGGDTREVAQDAVKPGLKLIMQSYVLWPPSRHVHAARWWHWSSSTRRSPARHRIPAGRHPVARWGGQMPPPLRCASAAGRPCTFVKEVVRALEWDATLGINSVKEKRNLACA